MTQSIPHERIVDVFPVPQFTNKLWKSRSFFRRSGSEIGEKEVVVGERCRTFVVEGATRFQWYIEEDRCVGARITVR